MRRRDFIKGVAGSAITWPLTARAQQPAMPVIGWLSSLTPEGGKPNLAAFRKALADSGYVEGHNVQIELSLGGRKLRSAAGDGGRFGRAARSVDRHQRWRASGICRQGRNRGYSHRDVDGRRS